MPPPPPPPLPPQLAQRHHHGRHHGRRLSRHRPGFSVAGRCCRLLSTTADRKWGAEEEEPRGDGDGDGDNEAAEDVDEDTDYSEKARALARISEAISQGDQGALNTLLAYVREEFDLTLSDHAELVEMFADAGMMHQALSTIRAAAESHSDTDQVQELRLSGLAAMLQAARWGMRGEVVSRAQDQHQRQQPRPNRSQDQKQKRDRAQVLVALFDDLVEGGFEPEEATATALLDTLVAHGDLRSANGLLERMVSGGTGFPNAVAPPRQTLQNLLLVAVGQERQLERNRARLEAGLDGVSAGADRLKGVEDELAFVKAVADQYREILGMQGVEEVATEMRGQDIVELESRIHAFIEAREIDEVLRMIAGVGKSVPAGLKAEWLCDLAHVALRMRRFATVFHIAGLLSDIDDDGDGAAVAEHRSKILYPMFVSAIKGGATTKVARDILREMSANGDAQSLNWSFLLKTYLDRGENPDWKAMIEEMKGFGLKPELNFFLELIQRAKSVERVDECAARARESFPSSKSTAAISATTIECLVRMEQDGEAVKRFRQLCADLGGEEDGVRKVLDYPILMDTLEMLSKGGNSSIAWSLERSLDTVEGVSQLLSPGVALKLLKSYNAARNFPRSHRFFRRFVAYRLKINADRARTEGGVSLPREEEEGKSSKPTRPTSSRLAHKPDVTNATATVTGAVLFDFKKNRGRRLREAAPSSEAAGASPSGREGVYHLPATARKKESWLDHDFLDDITKEFARKIILHPDAELSPKELVEHRDSALVEQVYAAYITVLGGPEQIREVLQLYSEVEHASPGAKLVDETLRKLIRKNKFELALEIFSQTIENGVRMSPGTVQKLIQACLLSSLDVAEKLDALSVVWNYLHKDERLAFFIDRKPMLEGIAICRIATTNGLTEGTEMQRELYDAFERKFGDQDENDLAFILRAIGLTEQWPTAIQLYHSSDVKKNLHARVFYLHAIANHLKFLRENREATKQKYEETKPLYEKEFLKELKVLREELIPAHHTQHRKQYNTEIHRESVYELTSMEVLIPSICSIDISSAYLYAIFGTADPDIEGKDRIAERVVACVKAKQWSRVSELLSAGTPSSSPWHLTAKMIANLKLKHPERNVQILELLRHMNNPETVFGYYGLGPMYEAIRRVVVSGDRQMLSLKESNYWGQDGLKRSAEHGEHFLAFLESFLHNLEGFNNSTISFRTFYGLVNSYIKYAPEGVSGLRDARKLASLRRNAVELRAKLLVLMMENKLEAHIANLENVILACEEVLGLCFSGESNSNGITVANNLIKWIQKTMKTPPKQLIEMILRIGARYISKAGGRGKKNKNIQELRDTLSNLRQEHML